MLASPMRGRHEVCMEACQRTGPGQMWTALHCHCQLRLSEAERGAGAETEPLPARTPTQSPLCHGWTVQAAVGICELGRLLGYAAI